MVEATDRLEGSPPVEEGEELEKVVCPVCGEIFNQSCYKAIVCAFVAQQSTPTMVEEQGQVASGDELRNVDKMEIEAIPSANKLENEQLQPQPVGEAKVLLGKPNEMDIESSQEQPQQLEVVDR